MDDQHLPHSLPSLVIREATEGDLSRVQTIYAYYVLCETSTFEEVAPDVEEVRKRREAVKSIGMPYLVAECGGDIVGYAYAGLYRPRTAYRFTVESSVYMDNYWRGRGIGSLLLTRLVRDAAEAGARQMIAVIGGSDNLASIGLHSRHGFRRVGTFTRVGFKFGRWLDSVLMQRELTTNS